MGKQSTITTLPTDILEQLQALLRDPRVTQMEATQRINAILAEQGEEPISKSAVNRYSLSMDKVGAKLSQSRAIADMWIGKLGNEPQGKVGALLNEMVRNLAFESAMRMSEDEKPTDPKLVKELAIAIDKLERAASINQKTAIEIEKRVLEKAASNIDKLEAGAQKSGKKLDAETLKAVREEIYGLVSQ